jgi:hypothetical protein
LRLLVDTDHPDAVRGSLQAVNEGQEPLSFSDEAALVALLKRLATQQMQPGIIIKEQKEKKQ